MSKESGPSHTNFWLTMTILMFLLMQNKEKIREVFGYDEVHTEFKQPLADVLDSGRDGHSGRERVIINTRGKTSTLEHEAQPQKADIDPPLSEELKLYNSSYAIGVAAASMKSNASAQAYIFDKSPIDNRGGQGGIEIIKDFYRFMYLYKTQGLSEQTTDALENLHQRYDGIPGLKTRISFLGIAKGIFDSTLAADAETELWNNGFPGAGDLQNIK